MRTVAEVTVQADGSIDAASQALILRDVRFFSGSNVPPPDRGRNVNASSSLLCVAAKLELKL